MQMEALYPRVRQALLAVLLLSPCTLVSSAEFVAFAGGRAKVPLPADVRVTTSDEGMVGFFGADGGHKLELTLLAILPSASGATDLGAQFVRDQAKQKRAKVSGTDGRAVFMEPGGEHEAGGRSYRVVHWQIGAGNCVFTMTITAPLPMSTDLHAFLGEPLNAIARGIECNAP
jgi:hypothetical protein